MILGEDNPHIPAFREITEGCKGVSDADKCEYTGKFMQCSHDAAKSRGINFIEIFELDENAN